MGGVYPAHFGIEMKMLNYTKSCHDVDSKWQGQLLGSISRI